ncbi:MAG: Glucose-6-phosphate 1-dehydrogenase [Cyphobasidiales sp. Tagirdzhanova-0007]|nr:MAG: Glucose-6-phosphate 1-dehydrogenase [Cyphobasidiales sp. Tagirdzhanova-0007]
MANTPSGSAPTKELTENTLVVVLGASGDLAKKKTFPALHGLYQNGFLPSGIHIIGYARTKMDEAEFHKRASSHINVDLPALRRNLDEFLAITSYVAGQYDVDEDFQKLTKQMEAIEKDYKGKERNRVFYMALPPSVFTQVAEKIKKNCYTDQGVNRIIVEKPFGKDLESSQEMMGKLKALWTEDETFRIDHYLGKEMVKNLLVLRFGNVILDASFNKDLISNVQITFKEPFGTEGRGGYFDEFGIIRDVMQNHLLQVLSILTMERPVSFSSEDIRDEKVKVLRYINPIEVGDCLIGQYAAANGKPGYKDDETVPKDSVSPTFACILMHINSPRWQGVPFIMKAGKALNEQKTEIRIQYKDVTHGIFSDIGRNELVIRVQPGEAVYLKMNTKAPGLQMRAVPTEMDLTYKRRFSDLKIPEAYEALILDAFKGDHSNFVRDDELDIAWKIFTPLLHYIEKKRPKLVEYPYGSRGPKELDEFIQRNSDYSRKQEQNYHWPTTDVNKL